MERPTLSTNFSIINYLLPVLCALVTSGKAKLAMFL